ncbi:alpha-hydroxy acid oxidase [Bosea sp. BH3]|uniref:alpha-hydroxy acid oxidase n=1 Tax=Bosea sp. BH3 TaxID=2871701 RepID=UPI0021CB32F0|nr:alpha-hydroxy acid oxidase [Bosea sp. BH3]MCU4181839.1 alpha-hydroxy-acid oxidizing protein [Bosea sp. BH3]
MTQLVPSSADNGSFSVTRQIFDEAQRNLPKPIWDYLSGGSESELTLRRNRQALDGIGLRPRVLRNVQSVDTATSLLGLPLSLPVFLAPIGSLGVLHRAGAPASARAATSAGTTLFFGVHSETPLDEVVRHASSPLVFQLYLRGDREWALAIIERAAKLGFHAVCITVDLPVVGRRERDILNRFSPLTVLDRPNLGADPTVTDGHLARADWGLIVEIIAASPLPVILKGIQGAEDAVLAVEAGAKVVYVSNHGGRQLDHAASSIEILPEVVAAVAGRAEIVIDSGFVRGSDIVKALALGARAVGLGKLHGWALAAGGEQGVRRMLDILREEVRGVMSLLGATSVGELSPASLRSVVPVDASRPYQPFPDLDSVARGRQA